MLNRIKTAAGTMVGSPNFRIASKSQEGTVSTVAHQGRLSARTRVFSGVLGAGLLGLLLSASVSLAQIGGVTPSQPPNPNPSSVVSLEVSIITPENGQGVARDCFRLNNETGAFRSDVLSANGFPDGFWYAVGTQGQSTALFTAHMSALAASSDGQPVPFTVSFGGILDQNGGMGAIVQSDGTPLAYQAQVNPNCSVSTAPAARSGALQGYGY